MRRLPTLALLLLVLAPALAAQAPRRYERRELTIPVRDGVTLHAVALLPVGQARPLPILLVRTPYNAGGVFPDTVVPYGYRELAEDGYLFVAEDIRGRFGSGGEYVTVRAQADPRSPRGINESTDTWDTIDWLVKHLPGNNGRVGALGISYPGWLTALAGVDPHPALKAISPQAPMSDTWMGDDFFHQGAFRQTQGVVFPRIMETDPKGFTFGASPMEDDYAYYLSFPTLDSLARGMGVTGLPSWQALVAHPSYDRYWQERALTTVLTRPTVPTLMVGGFWDQEDMYGPQALYRTLEPKDSAGWHHLVLGPWWHGGWMATPGDSIGPLPLGSATGTWFRANIQRPWFAHHLHGAGEGRFPEAWAFETGGNAWRTFTEWPPKAATATKLYLREDGRLAFAPPATATGVVPPGRLPGRTPAFDAYLSDPAHPVPYVPRPDDGSRWRTWLQQDQRFVDGRPDVLTFTSEPLTEDLVIAGDVSAQLFASTTGTDADWVVKLIDVYPDTMPGMPGWGGYQFMVNADILRGRYWRSFTTAAPIPANTVTPFTVRLQQQLYRFRKGHRLMVQVQSTWFPLYDRNPQVFVPSIFQARASDYRAQVHRVWHTARFPSHVVLPVLR